MIDVNDRAYTVPQLAKMWGRSVEAIRKRIYRHQLPARKMGRCWYIMNSELMQKLREAPSSLEEDEE